jgi:hypothetical protein
MPTMKRQKRRGPNPTLSLSRRQMRRRETPYVVDSSKDRGDRRRSSLRVRSGP